MTMRRSRGAEMLRGFAFLFTTLLAVVGIYGASEPVEGSGSEVVFPKQNYAPVPRKLLISPNTTTEDYGGGGDSADRIGMGGEMGCSKDSIMLFQAQTSPLPSGIPTYTVTVENLCVSEGCSISDIHLSCGWFSSARTLDPTVFRRLAYNDCLVNNGLPLKAGDVLSFEYANTFSYPMSVSSVTC